MVKRVSKGSVRIWVQTVCKGYQQTTKVAASKETVKAFSFCFQVAIMIGSSLFKLLTKFTNTESFMR